MVVIHLLCAEDLVELVKQAGAARLDAEDIIDLVNVVREGASSVQTRKHQQIVKVHALSVQHILVLGDIAANHVVIGLLTLDLAEVNATHTIDAGQDRVENLVLEKPDVGGRLHD